MLRIGVVLLLSSLAGCESSGSDGELRLKLADRLVALEAPSMRSGSLAIASSEGRLLAAWARINETVGTTIVGRFLDSNLEAEGGDISVSGPSEHALLGPSLCGASGVWSVVWSDGVPVQLLHQGISLDTANVAGSLFWSNENSPSSPAIVNGNETGEQTQPRIACLSEDSIAVSWQHRCVATEKSSDGTLYISVPAECADEPADGSYLGIIGDNGSDASGFQLSELVTTAAIAGIDDERVLVLLDSAIQVRAVDGALLANDVVNANFTDSSVACVNQHCVATSLTSYGLSMWLINPDSVASTSELAIKPVEDLAEGVVRPLDASLSCDDQGLCAVIWLSQREIADGDSVEIEALGVFGRAFDLHSGELGPEELIAPPDASNGAIIANLGSNEFVVAYEEASKIHLGTVSIEQ
jgi:hypothetical protein